MTASHFHVFLPPTLLPLSSFKTSRPAPDELIFHTLAPTARGIETIESLSQRRAEAVIRRDVRVQSSQPALEPEDRQEQVQGQQQEQEQESAGPIEKDEVESWEHSVVMDKPGTKRAREEVDDEDSITSLPGKSAYLQPRASTSRPLGPRRSSRMARTSDGHLTTLPGLDGTESFLSLNTTATISQPSQPPMPGWSIPLSKLVSLQSLLAGRIPQRRQFQHSDSAKISLMVCVMAVDTPVRRQRKEEKARGQEGTLWIGGWQVTAPPVEGETGEGGGVGCAVKLWEGLAREWDERKVRRGDALLLENVEFKPSTAKDPPSIVISAGPSSAPQPRITILYRTLPRRTASKSDYLPPRRGGRGFSSMLPPPAAAGPARMLAEDESLRPDLRLSRSDAGVRRVEEWAKWFANWVGGEPP